MTGRVPGSPGVRGNQDQGRPGHLPPLRALTVHSPPGITGAESKVGSYVEGANTESR